MIVKTMLVMIVLPGCAAAQGILRLNADAQLSTTTGAAVPLKGGTLVEKLRDLPNGRVEVRVHNELSGTLSKGLLASVSATANRFGIDLPPGTVLPPRIGPTPTQRTLIDMILADPKAAEWLAGKLKADAKEFDRILTTTNQNHD